MGLTWTRCTICGQTQQQTEPEAAVPVQHAPGKVICCPDCRAKSYTVCRDESAADQPGSETEADTVVAYRNTDRPGVLLCRVHGEGWAGLTPLTSEDLPDGGFCTWPGSPRSGPCGRDVLATPDTETEAAPQCSAGLLPATDAAVDRCVRRGKHDSHATAAGVRWGNGSEDEAQR
jgi:hypothetical protein